MIGIQICRCLDGKAITHFHHWPETAFCSILTVDGDLGVIWDTVLPAVLCWVIHNYFSKLVDVNLYNIIHFYMICPLTVYFVVTFFLIILHFCTNNIKLHAQMYMKFPPQFYFLFFSWDHFALFLQSYWDFKYSSIN